MKPKKEPQLKIYTLINQANNAAFIAVAIGAFVVAFSLVASKTLFSQVSYQQKVISEKKKTLKQLKDNIVARDELVKSYDVFIDAPRNVIGGDSGGTSDRDGDNAKIVLDALPSKYDFPALTASLEKLALAQGLTIENITGTDDEVAQQEQQTSVNPEVVPITFQFVVRGGYSQVQALIESFDKSIRPIQVQKIAVTGGSGGITATIDAQTFYQPEKRLEIIKKVIQ